MIVEKYESTTERQVLIALIMDRLCLAELVSVYQQDMFSCTPANLIASWCVQHYNKYNGKAPKKKIRYYFEEWSGKTKDKDSISYIEVVLENLNETYIEKGEQDSRFMIELMTKHLNHVRAKKLIEIVNGSLIGEKTEEALKKLESFRRLDLGNDERIQPFTNREVLRECHQKEEEDLIQYPEGAAREFFTGVFQKESLVSFVGAEKKGKSIWLLDVAFRSIQQRKRTLYVQVGDMSRRQILNRFCVRVAKRTKKPKIVKYPVSINKLPEQEDAEVEHEEIEFEGFLDFEESDKKFEELRRRMKSNEDLFTMYCYSNLSVSAQKIKSILQKEFDNGNEIEVLVLDYVDNLMPITHKYEFRHQVNETWSTLRGISTDFKICLVTATQANAKAYDKRTIDMSNFSEAKNKNGHVTAQIGINYDDTEKGKGITRLNLMPLREDEFISSKCLHVAGCRAINQPLVGKLSTW